MHVLKQPGRRKRRSDEARPSATCVADQDRRAVADTEVAAAGERGKSDRWDSALVRTWGIRQKGVTGSAKGPAMANLQKADSLAAGALLAWSETSVPPSLARTVMTKLLEIWIEIQRHDSSLPPVGIRDRVTVGTVHRCARCMAKSPRKTPQSLGAVRRSGARFRRSAPSSGDAASASSSRMLWPQVAIDPATARSC